MTETKFTPGPWGWKNIYRGGTGETEYVLMNKETGVEVLSTQTTLKEIDKRNLAAAPETYEKLLFLYDRCPTVFEDIEALISRIEGEA